MPNKSKSNQPYASQEDKELNVNQLIEKHREYVVAVVGKLVSQLRLPADEFDELLSAGYMGLVESAQRFSPKHNSAFRTYCFLRVRGAVLDHVRKMSAVNTTVYRKLKAMDALHELEEQFVSEQVAHKIEDPTAELAQVLDFASNAILSDQLCDEADGDPDSFLDTSKSFEEELERGSERLAMKKALETLSKKERSLIEGIYFKDKSFTTMARTLGRMGKSTISKLHAKTLRKLKFAYVAQLKKLDAIKSDP